MSFLIRHGDFSVPFKKIQSDLVLDPFSVSLDPRHVSEISVLGKTVLSTGKSSSGKEAHIA